MEKLINYSYKLVRKSLHHESGDERVSTIMESSDDTLKVLIGSAKFSAAKIRGASKELWKVDHLDSHNFKATFDPLVTASVSYHLVLTIEAHEQTDEFKTLVDVLNQI
jgi:hypothetical protein